MKTNHRRKVDWERSFTTKSDDIIREDIARIKHHVWNEIGPPYGRAHHDWATIRAALLREGRRRGLDVSAIAP